MITKESSKQVKKSMNDINALKNRYMQYKQQKPNMRQRDIAIELGVSEGELLGVRIGDGVTRLIDDAETILKEIELLGEVMALTRNEYCVHERKGVYHNGEFFSHGSSVRHGLFVNPDIDLRLFINHWRFAFAVSEESHGKERHSFQFFDKSGTAVHKIYITEKSNLAAYNSLLARFRHSNQKENYLPVEAYPSANPDLADDDIDWHGLRKEWENLKDTHDFYGMLRKFKVGRTQALRNIGNDLALQVANHSHRRVLELARDRQCEIMVFVGNRGCIQIHTGPVQKLVEHGPWYNVLDPLFNLHLREDKVVNTWITKKPTVDGIVSALEVFASDGSAIATFFGKRKPGIPELKLWREILSEIEVSQTRELKT